MAWRGGEVSWFTALSRPLAPPGAFPSVLVKGNCQTQGPCWPLPCGKSLSSSDIDGKEKGGFSELGGCAQRMGGAGNGAIKPTGHAQLPGLVTLAFADRAASCGASCGAQPLSPPCGAKFAASLGAASCLAPSGTLRDLGTCAGSFSRALRPLPEKAFYGRFFTSSTEWFTIG